LQLSTRRESKMILANLPHDLESEILARVPAKSLSQLKTTCKRWYALFNLMRIWVSNKVDEEGKELSWRKDFVLEVDFDKFQLPCEVNVASFLLNEEKKVAVFCETKATKGEEQTRIYIAGEGMYKQVCKEGSVNVTRLSYPLLLTYVPSLIRNETMMMMMISDLPNDLESEILARVPANLVVWNPCTGETKMIKPRTRYQIRDRFSLGYDDSRRGYKILRYGYYQNEEKVWFVECEMYDLSSDSWRFLESFAPDYGMYCSGVSLRGDTYFAAGGEVRASPLPFQSFDPEDTAVLSVVRDEKLSVCHQDILAWSNVMRIWVSNKVDEEGKVLSWRKDFVLTVDFDKFQLPCVVNVASFLLDEDKKVAMCCDVCDEEMKGEEKNRIYIVGEDIYKQVYNDDIVNASLLNCPLVLTYVPSLEGACVFMTTTSESLRNHCCVFFCNTPQTYLQFGLIPKLWNSVNKQLQHL
ncbi:hypothetical protein HID58_092748, partial [Brassica napus]